MFSFYQSTIGKKVVVAVTGLVLFGFIVGHLLGNLQIFLGAQAFNDYAAFLKKTKGLLWGTRLTLLAAVFLHIATTIQLVRRNRASRPIPYDTKNNLEASWASRTMIWGGLFLAAYIVFHLLHFTVGSVHPNFDHTDVYRNVITGFSVWYVTVFYVAAMIALGFHLYHGVWSLFQTLGLNHPKYNCWRRCLATLVAWVIPLGYSAIPLAVLLGIVQ